MTMNAISPKTLPRANIDLTIWDSLPIYWVNNNDELYELIDIIDGIDRVALDTEFVRRTTLYPILAVVQVNTGDAIYLLDAPKLDLTDFWQALAEIPEMVWYACGEDLTIFYQMSGCPPLTNVTDVQIGVGYLGERPQMGFAIVLEQVFGIKISKAEQASDWLKRPLSNEQERYASDDVRYLFALADFVKNELTHKGLYDFVAEDCQSYAKDIYNSLNVDDNTIHFGYLNSSYDDWQIACLNELLIWRKNIAEKLNRPMGNYFNRQVLREIVTAMPTSVYELSQTTINRRPLGEFGKEIVSIIKGIKALEKRDLPKLPILYYLDDKDVGKLLKDCANLQAEKLGILEGAFFKSRWLDGLFLATMNDDENLLPIELRGYRKAWVMSELMPIVIRHKDKLRPYGTVTE